MRARCGWATRWCSVATTSSTAISTSIRRVGADGRLVLRVRLRPQDGQHQTPIKDQGIVKTPVRIGPDVWIATRKTTCAAPPSAWLRAPGARRGQGHPRLLDRRRLAGQGGQNRKVAWDASAAQRAELAANLADIERKKPPADSSRQWIARYRSGSARARRSAALQRLSFAAFGGQVEPVRCGQPPCASRSQVSRCRAAIARRWAPAGSSKRRPAAARAGTLRGDWTARLPVDHRLAQTADVGGRKVPAAMASNATMPTAHSGLAARPRRPGAAGPAADRDRPARRTGRYEYLVFPGNLDQPVLLGAVAGDREYGAGVAAADARQCGDRVVNTLLVLRRPNNSSGGPARLRRGAKGQRLESIRWG